MNYLERVICGQLGQYGWSDLGDASDDAWRCERRSASSLRCGCPAWDGTERDLVRGRAYLAAGLEAGLVGPGTTLEDWQALACANWLDASIPGVLARKGPPHR